MALTNNRRTIDSSNRVWATLTIATITLSLLMALAGHDRLAQAAELPAPSYPSTVALNQSLVEPPRFIPPPNHRSLPPRFVYLPPVTDDADTVSYGRAFSHHGSLAYRTALATRATTIPPRVRRLPPVPVVCAGPTP